MKKDWKTSLIGTFLIGGAIYTGIMGISTWTESLLAITTGIGFILAEDTKKTTVGKTNTKQSIVGTRPNDR